MCMQSENYTQGKVSFNSVGSVCCFFFFVPGLALGGAEQEEDEGVDDQYGRAQQESDPPLT